MGEKVVKSKVAANDVNGNNNVTVIIKFININMIAAISWWPTLI